MPGRAGGYPPGPPTDPYVRNSRIRFLKQSLCCPRKDHPCSAVHWRAGVRVGELGVSPLFPARGTLCSTAPSLPWVAWASLPHLHWYYTPLRLPPCPSRVASLVARFPIPCVLPCVCGVPYGLVSWWKPRGARQGLWSPGPPIRERRQGDRWLSQVPEFPVKTCPALRPRWCPAHSPYRTQDCCLPALANRRLSSPYHGERYPYVHDYTHFGAQ